MGEIVDLASLAAAVPVIERKIADIDISQFVPGGVIKMQDLSIAQLTNAAADAQKIRIKRPDWPQQLCMQVALMAQAHVEPKGNLAPALFYMQVAETNTGMFGYLLVAFNEAFPHINNIEAAADEAEADFFPPALV